MTPEVANRLSTLNIQLLVEAPGHYLFARDTCIALVGRTETGISSIGSTGLMTDNGLAYLVWRGEQPVLAGKGAEVAAHPQQVEAIRQFSEDLKSALGI